MSPPFDLQSFLESFHRSQEASFITNKAGFILEANQVASNLFGMEIESLKNKGLITFGSRKRACDLIRGAFDETLNNGNGAIMGVNMRPRGGQAFRANLRGKILMQSHLIFLIHWSIVDADFLVEEATE